jgi:hypothetical protein
MRAPPDPPTRRTFLAGLGRLALGLSAIPGLALLRRLLGGRPEPLAESRVPVWHPQVSGFHGDDGLRVRRDGLAEVVLRGHEARLWCLCGGELSEEDLARALAAEEGIPNAEARAAVDAFLRPLYAGGYLLPRATPGPRSSKEVECRAGFREFPCLPPTS